MDLKVAGSQRELQRMSTAFDGSKAIREMVLMSTAIENIGGVTKLTDSEQRRYNSTLQEGLAKFKALGQEAPSELRKIAEETQKAVDASDELRKRSTQTGESISGLGGIASRLGPAIAGAFSVGAVVSFGKEIIDLAGHVTDLAARTGLSTDAVQELQHVADQTGTSVDTFTTAISKMGDALTEGDKGTVKAVKDLGLSLEDLRSSAPDKAFEAIATAIGKIPDPMRQTQLAMQLFGKSGVELLPAMNQGIAGLREEAHKLGVVLDKEAVRALDDFGDKWTTTMRSLKVSTATTALDIIAAFESIPRAVRALPKIQMSDLVEAITPTSFSDLIAKAMRGAALPFTLPIEILNVGRGERDKQAQEKALADFESLRDKFLKARNLPGERASVVPELSAETKAIKALADTLSGADVAGKLRQLDAAWKSLTPAQRENTDATKRLVEEYAKLRAQAGPGALPRDLEAFYRAHLPVIDGVKQLIDVTGRYTTSVLPDLSKRTQEVRNMLAGLTAEGLIPTSKAFGDLFDKMSIKPPNTLGDVGAKVLETKEQTVDLTASFDDLARSFAQLAQVSPLDGWIQDLATLIQLMNIGSQAGAQLGKGLEQIKQGGAGNIIGGSISMASGGIAGATAIAQATDVAGRGNRVLRGAATGASIGANPALATATGGWSIVVGAVAGAIVGAIRNPGFEQEMKRIANEFGVNIGEKLAREIDKLKKQFGGDRNAAEIFSIDKIIQDAGGLNDKNIGSFTGKLRDVFSMVEVGKFAVEDARNVLDRSFGAFADHIRQSEGIASKAFQDIIRLNEDFGTGSKAIEQFVGEQTGAIGEGLIRLAGPLMEQLQAGAAGSAEEFERLGTIAVGAFNAAVAAGQDWLTAVQNMGPALDQLIEIQQEMGIESQNAGLAELVRFRELVNQNQALVSATAALGETLRAVASIGGLTTETLAAMEAQGVQTFERLIAAGFSENEALRQMKTFLINVIEAHEQLGEPIDENTKRLIEMAEEQGLLKNDSADLTKIMKSGFDQVTATLGLVAKGLGVEIPAAIQKTIDALDEIPTEIDVGVNIKYNDPGFDPNIVVDYPGPEGAQPHDVPSFASGGVGNFGSGTLAMLHGREAIVPLDRWGGGGGRRDLHVHVVMPNGRELAHAIVPEIPDVLAYYGARH